MKSFLIKALSSAAIVPLMAIGALSANAGEPCSGSCVPTPPAPVCCQPVAETATVLKSFSYQNPQYFLKESQSADSLIKYKTSDFNTVHYDATSLKTADYLSKQSADSSKILKMEAPQKSSVFFSSFPVFSW